MSGVGRFSTKMDEVDLIEITAGELRDRLKGVPNKQLLLAMVVPIDARQAIHGYVNYINIKVASKPGEKKE